MIVYVVKEIILCTMDGTVENNIIGIFNKKEKALEAIDERSEELLKEFEDLIPESDVNKGIGFFCMESSECWYEFYIEVNIEEKMVI